MVNQSAAHVWSMWLRMKVDHFWPVRRKKSVRDGESQRFCLDELLLPVAKAVGVSTPAIELPAAYRPQRLLMLCRNDP
jgi:hypothetical protein